MTDDLEQLKRTAKRLERYAQRLGEKIWQGNLIDALADTAEAGEISRRLYLQLQAQIQPRARRPLG
jgi:hypothetical protein